MEDNHEDERGRTRLAEQARSLSEELLASSFDAILFAASFHYFSDPKALFGRCGELLVPAGMVLITDSWIYRDDGERAKARERSVAYYHQLGVPGMSPTGDGSRYFLYHHSHADTIDKPDPRDMGLVTAALVAGRTGDLSLLRDDLRPDPMMVAMPQGGLGEEQSHETRAAGADVTLPVSCQKLQTSTVGPAPEMVAPSAPSSPASAASCIERE